MWSAIWTALESIPMTLKLVQQAFESFELWQLSRIDAKYSSKTEQRKAILSILGKTNVTDQERIAVIRLLYDLRNDDKLSDERKIQ